MTVPYGPPPRCKISGTPMVPMKLNTQTMAATDEQFFTRVLVNTGSNLNQTANNEEGGGWSAYMRPEESGLEQACNSGLFPGCHASGQKKSHSPDQVSINSNNLSSDCKKTVR